MTGINSIWNRSRNWLATPVDSVPLAIFRIALSLLLLVGGIRFWLNGWIDAQFIDPSYYFSYFGFEWVQPLPEAWMIKGLYGLMLLSFVGMALAKWYRLSAIVAFGTFSYFELLDKTNYLNHYYFVMILLFLMVFIPAHKAKLRSMVMLPRWTIFIIQLQFAILYVHAGLAKVHWEWLVHAMPLKLWLPMHMDQPVIGGLMKQAWVAYIFSYFGLIYDLLIPFALWWSRTRKWAYLTVVVFHMATWLLFPIGLFPFIMMVATTVFFTPKEWRRFLGIFKAKWLMPNRKFEHAQGAKLQWVFAAFLLIQVALPWRFLFYEGPLFWHEQGYRFSWRVMLMEKAGAAEFAVTDPATGRTVYVSPADYLTPNQEKMMATQPDMILQFAHYLDQTFQTQGIENPEVRVMAHVTLNGRPSQLLIDPDIDLTQHEESFKSKTFILPLNSRLQ